MLLSTCVLCAKCKVWFSVLQLRICPCETGIMVRRGKGADWLPSRNLKFNKLLNSIPSPNTHTPTASLLLWRLYESFLLGQSLKLKVSPHLLNNLHMLAPHPPPQSLWKCPLWEFPPQVTQRNLEPISLKQVCVQKKGRGEPLRLFNQFYHFLVC